MYLSISSITYWPMALQDSLSDPTQNIGNTSQLLERWIELYDKEAHGPLQNTLTPVVHIYRFNTK